MYDTLIANLISGNSIIEPTKELDDNKIQIGFSNIGSKREISKYFIIQHYPDWLDLSFLDRLRYDCISDGVKLDYYFYCEDHKIKWNSQEMKYKMNVWKEYANETTDKSDINVFEYRNKRNASLSKDRLVLSTKYLNEAELDHNRKTLKVIILIKLSSLRDDESIMNLSNALTLLKENASRYGIKLRELRANLLDWLRYFSPFSLSHIPQIHKEVPKKVITDDLLAQMNPYKQGMLGNDGICLGVDVLSNTPVLKKFKEHSDMAENWLVSAETGGGKSYFVKNMLMFLLADGFVCTVLDYEGDEYTNLASYISASNPEDVKVVSMGKGSNVYYDPMPIPLLPNDCEINSELKELSMSYALAMFRIVASKTGELDKTEDSLISTAIKKAYESAGVTDDMSTWHRSKNLSLRVVYDFLKDMLQSNQYQNASGNSKKHETLERIVDNCRIYFEDGESKSGTFKNPMSAEDLFKAKFIVFSFGMRGASSDQTDPVSLALKQLSVSNLSIQISNYCKYVRKCFNVKIWEEMQRWGEVKGSAEVIGNAMTGGRKRGDVNIIITNDLASLLDEDNKLNTKLSQNIQYFAIGKVKDTAVLEKFCKKFNLEVDEALLKISGNSTSSGRYYKAFCLIMDSKKSIVQVRLSPDIANSRLFNTGVEIE